MITWTIRTLAAVFMVATVLEFLGSAAFLTVYVARSDWRSTPVGRHLVWYGTGVVVLLGASVAWRFWPSMALLPILLAGHAVFLFAVWQRFVLVLREQRKARKGQDDGQDS